MKYRVEFKCYWYNTGMADNHFHTNYEDFDTIEEAKEFKSRVDTQYFFDKKGTFDEREEWFESEKSIEIENGFIDGYGKIVKYFPERIEELSEVKNY